jgi:hypothetical protein
MHKDVLKKERMLLMLDQIGINNITIIDAVDAEFISDTQFNAISMSHEMAIDVAIDYRGPVLILEDDCLLNNGLPGTLVIPDDADAVYLGHSAAGVSSIPVVIKDTTFADITGSASYSRHNDLMYRISSMVGAHAILYISDRFKVLANELTRYAYNKSINHDILFVMLQQMYNVYGYYNPYFVQTSQYQLSREFLNGN